MSNWTSVSFSSPKVGDFSISAATSKVRWNTAFKSQMCFLVKKLSKYFKENIISAISTCLKITES